jgi:hypothetical protein
MNPKYFYTILTVYIVACFLTASQRAGADASKGPPFIYAFGDISMTTFAPASRAKSPAAA